MAKRAVPSAPHAVPRLEPAPAQPPPPVRLIRKVLVANRGEIACRIMRTCRDMGIATVAVFSDADAAARHVREADEAVRLGASPPTSSYLNAAALIEAARRTGADAVHPGYGFLAEHAPFAADCRAAGLTCIGPDSEAIRRMGSKREARHLMAAAGIPIVPGYDGDDQSDERFIAAARQIGYPVMVKASAGGGGRGMRIVAREQELPQALAAGRREASSAFGDPSLLLERAISAPRHVEFQIVGDAHGHLIQLGERECSIQRRHQKIVEETPSLALTPALRARMGESAVAVGRLLGYSNAGTVEFILDADGRFYFLEVNTRLQVEHPITELVTGVDLVRWQILVAEGRPLPLAQDEVVSRGHAIEARLYAEDPANEFLPATGPVALWRPPTGTGVRVESGIETGDQVTAYYDPLLAKICACGDDRAEALRRLDRALADTTLLGVRTNLDLLRRIALHPAHLAGAIGTDFIARHADELLSPPTQPAAERCETGAAGAALAAALQRLPAVPGPPAWRNNRARPIVERFTTEEPGPDGSVLSGKRSIEVRLLPDAAAGAFTATLADEQGETALPVLVHARSGADLWLEIAGRRLHAVALEANEGEWWVKVGAATHRLIWRSPLPEPRSRAETARTLAAPMPGQVVSVLVQEGQAVRAGDPLLILHAMKMEHVIAAPHDGTVVAVYAHAGESVGASATLLEVRPAAADRG